MKKLTKNMILRVFIWILTILWMGGIFYMSSRPVELSRQDSAWVMEKLKIADSEEAALDTSNSDMMSLQMYIRKKAHVVLYAGLAILVFLSLYGYVGKADKTALMSLIITTLYGGTDEIHQIFTHRGAQLQDVLVDARGAVWGLMWVLMCFIIIENSPKLMTFVDRLYKINFNVIQQQ